VGDVGGYVIQLRLDILKPLHFLYTESRIRKLLKHGYPEKSYFLVFLGHVLQNGCEKRLSFAVPSCPSVRLQGIERECFGIFTENLWMPLDSC
jgi:hypothetical protein